MPHLSLEYSANMEGRVDISALCNVIRLAAIETGVFPMKGIRVRAIRCDHYSIADGGDHHGFIDISVRLREGRPQAKKEAATADIFAAAQAFLAVEIASRSIALSLEMRDIDASLSPKINTIPDHL